MIAPRKIYKDTHTHTHTYIYIYTQRVSILGMGFDKAFHNISQQHTVITLSYRLNIVSVEKQSNRLFFFTKRHFNGIYAFKSRSVQTHIHTKCTCIYIHTHRHPWMN